MIPFGIFVTAHISISTYLVICRAIGKERISTILAIVTYFLANPIALVICVCWIELGVYSYWWAFIFQNVMLLFVALIIIGSTDLKVEAERIQKQMN